MNQTITTFGYPGTVIREFNHWVVMLRPEQVTVGTLVLAAKSEVTSLGALTAEEWSEFAGVSSFAENLLRSVFGAEKFNYLALMMEDPNVHFHLVPRYSKPVAVAGQQFVDPDWPLKTELKTLDMTPATFETIKADLQQ
jgi:diadenosine tetraphosphate (Ap4A) HIT family hydrolase